MAEDSVEAENTEEPEEPEDVGSIGVVEFGQPLPNVATSVTPASPLLIPAGTVLPLRYPGTAPLRLPADAPWQEVLLLNEPLLDRTGTLIAPAGSPVIGQFEVTEEGSVFTARAIVLEGRNIRLDAATETIEPRSDLIQPNQVIEAQLSDNALISD
ncbi:MAG: hypothetical protein HC878_18835 [Leptolyngbyaceae cyanobacterium SL_5_14]|nr:hypothetical protein [Leptolyngbyaceae cyanobacterium SL_5_14]